MKFEIKNFRVFDKEGSTFNLKPITLLTGANSSGKSSLAKAFLLFEDFLSQYLGEGDFNKCFLNFSSDRFKLGNYSCVLHNEQGEEESGCIEFSYLTHSDFLNIDARVTVVFKSDPNDQVGNGHFYYCDITSLRGEKIAHIQMKEYIFGEWKRNEPFYDLNLPLLRKLFFDKYRPYCEEDEEGNKDHFGIEADDLFFQKYSSTIYSQIKHNSLFLFNNIKDFGSFDAISFIKYHKGINENTKADLFKVAALFEKSNKRCFGEFFSSLEDNSKLRYTDRFDIMDGLDSLTPLLDYARTKKIQAPVVWAGPNCEPIVEEQRVLECNEEDPFNFVLGVLSHVNCVILANDASEFDNNPSFDVFINYIKYSINDLLNPHFVGHVHYVPSDKVSIRRLYDFGNDQDSFHNLLKRYLNAKSDFLTNDNSYYHPYPKMKSFSPGDFINKWLSRFGIGDRLQIETLSDGLGIVLRLYSNGNDQEGHLLADEGYGISQLVSLLMSIEICIMEGFKAKGIAPRFTLVVEEPEIHLHPKYQSLLADLFWSSLYDYRVCCIVETHSEYLIRRMQVISAEFARKNNLTDEEMDEKCPVSVYYFSKDKHPYEMEMRSDGMFINDFGTGFFDEAAKLHLQILYRPSK